jgi:hypothetical protein
MNELKNNTSRAKQVVMILKVILLFDLLMILFDIMEFNLLTRISRHEDVGDLELHRNAFRQAFASISYTLVSLSSGIAFLGWFYRAYRNISLTHMVTTNLKPIWAVWSFIIPAINLYLPCAIMREIREKYLWILADGKDKAHDRKEYLLILWWSFWLISILSSMVYLALLVFPPGERNRIGLSLLSILSDFTDIPAALFAILIIGQVSKLEHEVFDKFSSHREPLAGVAANK